MYLPPSSLCRYHHNNESLLHRLSKSFFENSTLWSQMCKYYNLNLAGRQIKEIGKYLTMNIVKLGYALQNSCFYGIREKDSQGEGMTSIDVLKFGMVK